MNNIINTDLEMRIATLQDEIEDLKKRTALVEYRFAVLFTAMIIFAIVLVLVIKTY